MSHYFQASGAVSPVGVVKSLAIAAALSMSSTACMAQEHLGNLQAQGYHETFVYNFGADNPAEDFDGSKIWEGNLWYQGHLDPRFLVRQNNYVTLLTVPGKPKMVSQTSLVTWSKSKKAPLEKFHYGYMEATMRFPSSATNWPAFWGLSTTLPLMPKAPDGQATGRWCEIDVYEGSTAGIYAANAHDWTGHHQEELKTSHTALPPGSDLSHWNTYAALWTKETIKYYFNGIQVNETPTPKPCQDDDLFLIVTSQTRDAAAGSMQMDVKQVRVLQK